MVWVIFFSPSVPPHWNVPLSVTQGCFALRALRTTSGQMFTSVPSQNSCSFRSWSKGHLSSFPCLGTFWYKTSVATGAFLLRTLSDMVSWMKMSHHNVGLSPRATVATSKRPVFYHCFLGPYKALWYELLGVQLGQVG